MEVTLINKEKYLLVTINGRLDTFTSADFEKKYLEDICQAKKRSIVDCSNLSYISSAGLRIILALAKKLGTGGLCLIGVTGLVEEVINMSGFDSLLPIYKSLKEAEENVNG